MKTQPQFLACAIPTVRNPHGRTGTSAGYQAHRGANEPACSACLAAQTAKSVTRKQALSAEGLHRHRQGNLAATRRRKAANPDKIRVEKHRFLAANREIIRAAKDVPCADCSSRHPYYVMQFDHLGEQEKHFNIGAHGPSLGRDRLIAEIAKCEVVCANCHAERTHRRKLAKREVRHG